MNVVVDQWTPFFEELESRVNSEGRRKLLFQVIGDVYDVTVGNFGDTGIARPEEWPSLSVKYADEKHGGNRTPTLILTGALKEGFVVEFNDQFASITNLVEYSDLHQFGENYLNLPARPFYPVDEQGLALTQFMQERINGIVFSHFTF